MVFAIVGRKNSVLYAPIDGELYCKQPPGLVTTLDGCRCSIRPFMAYNSNEFSTVWCKPRLNSYEGSPITDCPIDVYIV